MFYSRLYKLFEMSKELADFPPEVLNQIAVELGIQKSMFKFTESDRYSDFLVDLSELIDGNLDINEFEDRARSMFSTNAYISFTLDKLAQQLSKQVLFVLGDPVSMDILNMFFKDLETDPATRQEAVYRASAEALTSNENLYRIEYVFL